MLSRARNHFKGAKFARMSSGTYCIIRDLGLVKGGKGMRHHEVLVTFSLREFCRTVGLVRGGIVGAGKRRAAWLWGVPEQLEASVRSSAVPERASRP
jgi:hypothetical protein